MIIALDNIAQITEISLNSNRYRVIKIKRNAIKPISLIINVALKCCSDLIKANSTEVKITKGNARIKIFR